MDKGAHRDRDPVRQRMSAPNTLSRPLGETICPDEIFFWTRSRRQACQARQAKGQELRRELMRTSTRDPRAGNHRLVLCVIRRIHILNLPVGDPETS